jgi:hypothetical protein
VTALRAVQRGPQDPPFILGPRRQNRMSNVVFHRDPKSRRGISWHSDALAFAPPIGSKEQPDAPSVNLPSLTLEDAMAHIQSTTRELQNAGNGIAANISDQAESMAKQAGSTIQEGVGQANAAIGAVTERTGQMAERTGEVVGNFRSAIETSARSQPTTTVLLAALAGFAFGAIWRMGR